MKLDRLSGLELDDLDGVLVVGVAESGSADPWRRTAGRRGGVG